MRRTLTHGLLILSGAMPLDAWQSCKYELTVLYDTQETERADWLTYETPALSETGDVFFTASGTIPDTNGGQAPARWWFRLDTEGVLHQLALGDTPVEWGARTNSQGAGATAMSPWNGSGPLIYRDEQPLLPAGQLIFQGMRSLDIGPDGVVAYAAGSIWDGWSNLYQILPGQEDSIPMISADQFASLGIDPIEPLHVPQFTDLAFTDDGELWSALHWHPSPTAPDPEFFYAVLRSSSTGHEIVLSSHQLLGNTGNPPGPFVPVPVISRGGLRYISILGAPWADSNSIVRLDEAGNLETIAGASWTPSGALEWTYSGGQPIRTRVKTDALAANDDGDLAFVNNLGAGGINNPTVIGLQTIVDGVLTTVITGGSYGDPLAGRRLSAIWLGPDAMDDSGRFVFVAELLNAEGEHAGDVVVLATPNPPSACEVFADGFESGTAGAWSDQEP